MKKFELHLDALITLIVVFVLAFTFILYQRYQYSDLLQETVDLKWEAGNINANLIIKTALAEKCENQNTPDNEIKEALLSNIAK